MEKNLIPPVKQKFFQFFLILFFSINIFKTYFELNRHLKTITLSEKKSIYLIPPVKQKIFLKKNFHLTGEIKFF